MKIRTIGIALAAVAALGAGVVGGTALAAGSGGTDGTSGATAGYAARGGDGNGAGPWGGAHTPVTGSELAKVKAAVAAKDSAVTVQQVHQDADGSYDVFGTTSGRPVALEVSKDLATITTRTGGPGGGHGGPGGPGGSPDTAVTGDEAARAGAAVKAAHSSFTVGSVRKDPDGSYDVMGTQGGRQVVYDVSKDLRTITERTAPQGAPVPPQG